MEGKSINKVVVTIAVAVLMVAVAEGKGKDVESVSKECYHSCFGKCGIRKPLFCATLCLSKCKHSLSIPDNLCNCTYSCSKFKCANVDANGILINFNHQIILLIFDIDLVVN